LEDQSVDGRIILKYFEGIEYEGMDWMNPVPGESEAGNCEYCN
jgi:hypothetical protein